MFGISYTTWKNVCEMYINLGTKNQKYFLQWFPFTKLSNTDKETLLSKKFYDTYISSGGFCQYPSMMHRSENYIQKGDGSFRDASLVSPILYSNLLEKKFLLSILLAEIETSRFTMQEIITTCDPNTNKTTMIFSKQ